MYVYPLQYITTVSDIILTSSSLASVTSLSVTARGSVVVCIGPCPLEVDTLVLVDGQSIGHKVVLHGRICLDNVPTLSTDIEVMDGASFGISVSEGTARAELHDVGAVLEGTTKLSGVDGQTKRFVSGRADVNIGVLLHRGENSSTTVEVITECKQ